MCVSPLTPHLQSVAVGSLCDNIEVDPESGDLWLGCHPNAWKFFMSDPNDPPGSEVCPFSFKTLNCANITNPEKKNLVCLDLSYASQA